MILGLKVAVKVDPSVRLKIDPRAQTVLPFQCGGRLYTSESDVCRRQILTYKDDPALKKNKNIYNGRIPLT